MCYYIMLSLPSEELPNLSKLTPTNVILEECKNPHLRFAIPNNYTPLFLTSGHCSCDLYHNSVDTTRSLDNGLEKLESQYERKGWSKAKIKRALADVKRGKPVRNEATFLGLRSDIIQFVESFCSTSKSTIQLLVHYYSGNIEKEQFEFSEVMVPRSQIAQFSLELPEDVLVKFIPSG